MSKVKKVKGTYRIVAGRKTIEVDEVPVLKINLEKKG